MNYLRQEDLASSERNEPIVNYEPYYNLWNKPHEDIRKLIEKIETDFDKVLLEKLKWMTVYQDDVNKAN